jgi:hypothetical protein
MSSGEGAYHMWLGICMDGDAVNSPWRRRVDAGGSRVLFALQPC